MSAAPNNRARLTRYNVLNVDGSSSIADATANGRSTTDVGADGGSAAADPAGRNRCGGSATRDEAVNNED